MVIHPYLRIFDKISPMERIRHFFSDFRAIRILKKIKFLSFIKIIFFLILLYFLIKRCIYDF